MDSLVLLSLLAGVLSLCLVPGSSKDTHLISLNFAVNIDDAAKPNYDIQPSLSTRRRALQPFDLSDGTKLAVGDWACTPSGAIMRDERHYAAASEFNGFRFVDPEILGRIGTQSSFNTPQPRPSKLTDVDNTFPMWGTGRMSW
ncbi:hypothetical protein SODALDRAFT_322958 [Sodiomyces alkalinus F11]|uniref:Uncharacterized protein n=1 Tax=Sodiomyces alkalinus (strain CBS 110278 / VKM F-3762 / F11) TaxID=1314773 RepID=A0A3N2PZ08_SODAK|nr:hypothetical protein SODALDRAFT_322958 [Sodiomyces alkalinus F11]ROT39585.1 hypothetical protein SODALDRAFT_322958 [Sodiomyces alkalinus F11]